MANPEESNKTKDKEADTQQTTVKRGGSSSNSVGTGEDTSLRGGRNRFCKQCKFTCKDSREFSQHQLSAHGESEETRSSQNSLCKENSSRRGSTKSQSPQSAGYHKTDHLAGSNSNNTSKMNREVDENTGDHIYKDTEEDELDDRLVIAEEHDESYSHTPIRSGNIQNRTYICPSCDFSSTSAKVFLHHQKDIHGKDFTIYECDVCDYATRYKQKLPRHRKLHFPGLEFNNSSSGATGSMSVSDNTADNSDIAMVGEDDIRRKLDDDLEDELDEEEMDITADEGLVIDDTMKQKTKRTRQEVDPAKYIEVMDDSGIKYSCSKCGNIYKWRKSLNKHWKEKHADEKLDGLKAVPPTLNPVKHISSKSAHEYMRQEACDKFAFKKESKPNGYTEEESACGDVSSSVSDCVMPKMIGPFITNSYVPIYSTENSQSSSGQPGVDHEALDLSSKPTTSSSRSTQREPLDFSFKKEPYMPVTPEMVAVKAEPIWDDENEMSKNPEDSQQASPVLQCIKCAFVAKTFVDYSSHMAVHLNKRAFKCAECQQHFNCVEELNNHFGKAHVEKIQEHRDVIQKIPHGLQQTYHLLQMPLASSEFSPTESRQLKCSRCDFVAKWPAELQKHAVSHSEERPFICMVCGSTYKWKWDLVKHFEKSHSTLTNPYKRRPTVSGPNGSCIGSDSTITTVSRTADALVDRNLDSFILSPMKKRRLSETDLTSALHPFYQEDAKHTEIGTKENRNSSDTFRHNNRTPPIKTHERPSSVPPNFNHVTDKNFQNDKESEDNGIPGLQITNVFSLVKEKPMVATSESQEASTSQVSASQQSAEQHRAVNAALRQRINMSNNRSRRQTSLNSNEKDKSCADILLPYKCTLCQYRARWPSEITQHMKNHSDEKPFCCPECSYKSKWKWDVVKHMKRCGGGTVKDVIDNSKQKSCGPPNVVLAVREEPNNNQNIPKLSNTHVANGETTPISYKNSASRVSTPSAASVAATAAATAATAAAAATAADGRSHSQSLLDLRRDSSSSRPNPVFRGLVNDGLYHCLECQFIGHSPAELKRHAYLHSEDKPYVCEVCSYSSRWKCDLKKHIRTYNHHHPRDPTASHSDGSDQPNQGSATYDHSSSFQSQMDEKLNKDDDFPDDVDTRSVSSFYSADYQKPLKEPVKQSCTKCSFVTDDLAAFLQHRLTHDNSHTSNNNGGSGGGSSSSSTSSSISQQTSVPINAVSSRTRHLKNRRKPMKQFRCPKCPFVCLTEHDLSIHEGRHKPQGSNAVKCFYCDFSVLNSNKVALIQHLHLHPEFDPSDKSKLKEILNYSDLLDVWQANEDNEEMDDVSYEYYEPPEQMDVYRERPSMAEQKKEEKEVEIQALALEEPQPVNGMMLKKEPNMSARLQCEWCEAAFVHISTLYQHARSVHPILLQQQEYENNIKYDDFPAATYNGMAVSQNSTFNVILPKIAQTPKKIQPSTVIKPKKNPSPGKTGGPFKCQKCPFIGASSNTYSRHMERHGSNCKHTCLYCDYSIDRLNLLHQHMRGSHGHDVKQSPLNSSNSEKSVHNGLSKAETPNRVILTTPTYIQKNESSNETHLRLIAPKPVEIKNNEISTSLPILENNPNGKYLYRCPTCSFTSPKVNATMSHIRTHSTGNTFDAKPLPVNKQTEYKNFIHTQQQSGKKIGSNCSLDNSFQSSCDCNDIQLGQPKMHSQQSSQVSLKNVFACQQCPFKTTSKDSLQEHQELHGYKGQYQCEFCNFSVDHINLFCDHSALHSNNNNLVNSNNSDNDNNNNSISNNMSVQNSNNNASNTNSGHHPLHQHHNHQSKQIPTQADTRFVTTSQPKVNLHRPFGGVQFRSKYDSERRNKLNIQQMLKQVKNTGRVRYKCMQCPYRTCCKNNIIKHRKQHIIKSRYKCPYCNYSAARKYLLQQHLKFHRDEPGEQEKDFQDVVLDPYDENSVKSLKNSSDLLNAEKKTLQTSVSSSLVSGRFTVQPDETESVKNLPKSISVPNQSEEHSKEGETNSNADDQKGKHFQCNACPFSCSTSYEYQKHCQCHNAQMKYTCDFCSYSVDRYKLLSQHQHLHIPQSTYVPSEDLSSNMDTTDESSNAPESTCSPQTKDAIKDKLFKCPVVTKEVDSNQLYETDTQLDGNDEAMRYKCQFCPYMSNSLKSFNVHSRMHGLKRKYKCDYCNWSADRLNLLNQHRKVHSREPNFDPNPDELTFLNREAALQHKETVPPLKHFSKTTTRLLGKKQYSCKMCLFSCNNKSSFVSHMGLHHSHPRYLCKYCGYSTDRRNLYQQHEKSHISQGEEAIPADGKMNTKSRIRCPKCPYHCSAEHLLSSHMKMHESDQRYVCDYCKFCTSNYYVFHEHLEIHNEASQKPETDERNDESATGEEKYDENESDDEYSCDLCSFSTTSIDEMRLHESQHEGLDDEISCPYCSFTCTKETDIKQHVTVHQCGKAESATDSQEIEKVAPEDLTLNQNNTSPSQPLNNVNDDVPPDAGSKFTPITAKSDGMSMSATNPTNMEVDSPQDDDQKRQTTVNHVLSTPVMTNSSHDTYTCQYCERNFKDKNQMQMHEKQHLKGYENLEAVQ